MEILTIESMEDIEIAVHLLNVPEFSKIFLLCGPIPLRREPPGFATLFKIVIGQQVSVRSTAFGVATLEPDSKPYCLAKPALKFPSG